MARGLKFIVTQWGGKRKFIFHFFILPFLLLLLPLIPTFLLSAVFAVAVSQKILFFNVCTCVCRDEYLLCVFRYLRDQKGTSVCSWSHRLSREQLHMGIESRIGVLWKSNGCSEPLSYRSSPSTLCAHACSSCVCVSLDAMRE